MYSNKQFLNSGLDGLIENENYQWITTEGTFRGRLDYKHWGRNGNTIMSYFTLDDGRKIKIMTWHQIYGGCDLGLDKIDIGTSLFLTFTKSSNNKMQLRNIRKEIRGVYYGKKKNIKRF